MPESLKMNKVTQRWNPGSASATLTEAAAPSDTTGCMIAANPSAKNDTFVSEGTVKDRLSMWGTKKGATKKAVPLSTSTLSMETVTNPTESPTDNSMPIPSSSSMPIPTSSSHSASSKRSSNVLLSSSVHSTESVESLTGGSSHRDRLAAWGKATNSVSRLSGHEVVEVETTKTSRLSTSITTQSPLTYEDRVELTATAPLKSSRTSLIASNRGAISMSNIHAMHPAPAAISVVRNDVPGMSVKDRMKSWGKTGSGSKSTTNAPSLPSKTVTTESTSKPAVVAIAAATPHVQLQPSESADTQDSTSKISSVTNDASEASTSLSASGKSRCWQSPPSGFVARTLKKITPPTEDKHKHQQFTGSTIPSVELKKVALQVEGSHIRQLERFVESPPPTLGLKTVEPLIGKEKVTAASAMDNRPSLYSATSLRCVGKPKEDKWKDTANQIDTRRPSLYSGVSLRNVDRIKDGPGKTVVEETKVTPFPAAAVNGVGVLKEDKAVERKAKNETDQKQSVELYSASKLRSVNPVPRSQKDEAQSPPPVFFPARLRNVDKPREDKWKSMKNPFNTDGSALDSYANGTKTLSKNSLAARRALSSSAQPDMPAGEKTEEVSPLTKLSPSTPARYTRLSQRTEQGAESLELILDNLPLESPANAPAVPPSPLEILVRESVIGSSNKLLMLMSSMSGRQDQKTAQDRALTILKGLQVSSDQMELLDGADPANRKRRNELFGISGIRAQYPQFFLVDATGKAEFLGDWDSFEMMHDSGHLGESMNLGGSQDNIVFSKVSSVTEIAHTFTVSRVDTTPTNLSEDSKDLKDASHPMHQDCKSLDFDNLFDVVEVPTKPQLAEERTTKEFSICGNHPPNMDPISEHLKDMNQLTTKYDDDVQEVPAKPLLAAVLKSKDQSDHKIDQSDHKIDPTQVETTCEHLKDMNQPKTQHEADKSLDNDDLFDDVVEEVPVEPLLAAALKAKELSEHGNDRPHIEINSGHLKDMSQPKAKNELDADDQYYDLKENVHTKPVLAVALKVKDLVEHGDYISHINTSSQHVKNIKESKANDEDDKMLASDNLFDDVVDTIPAKPLINGALNAKELSELVGDPPDIGFCSDHFNSMKQPKTWCENRESVYPNDLFDDSVKEVPLLAAATLAAHADDRPHDDPSTDHLKSMHQPKVKYEDEKSLDSDDLFDDVVEDIPARPFLAAALKAKELSEHGDESDLNEASYGHLKDIDQPKTKHKKDKSLENIQFDDMVEEVPAPKTVKAKKVTDHAKEPTNIGSDSGHSNDVNHPKAAFEEVKSFDGAGLFDDDLEQFTAKPSITVAQAKELSEHEYDSTHIETGSEHLKDMNQPKTKYEDDKSLDTDDLFDDLVDEVPAKPLLAAALKAKELSEHGKYSKSKANADDGRAELLTEENPTAEIEAVSKVHSDKTMLLVQTKKMEISKPSHASELPDSSRAESVNEISLCSYIVENDASIQPSLVSGNQSRPSGADAAYSLLLPFGEDQVIYLPRNENSCFARGAFGDVSLAIRQHRDAVQGKYFLAIKTIENAVVCSTDSRLVYPFYRQQQQISKEAFNELLALRLLNPHPNIVQLIAFFPTPRYSDFDSCYSLSFAFEYSPIDLQQALEWRKKNSSLPLSFPVIRTILRDVLTGIDHCHKTQVVHRDVKPGNLLVTSSGLIQLCDFGLAKPFLSRSVSSEKTSQPVAGAAGTKGLCTLYYRPPEVLFGASASHPSVDIYSVGLVLAELIQGTPLWEGRNVLGQLSIIFDSLGTPNDEIWPAAKHLPDFVSFDRRDSRPWHEILPRAAECPPFLQILSNMVTLNPEVRVSAKQSLEHLRFDTLNDASRTHLCDELIRPNTLQVPNALSTQEPKELVETGISLAKERRTFLAAGSNSNIEPTKTLEEQLAEFSRKDLQTLMDEQAAEMMDELGPPAVPESVLEQLADAKDMGIGVDKVDLQDINEDVANAIEDEPLLDETQEVMKRTDEVPIVCTRDGTQGCVSVSSQLRSDIGKGIICLLSDASEHTVSSNKTKLTEKQIDVAEETTGAESNSSENDASHVRESNEGQDSEEESENDEETQEDQEETPNQSAVKSSDEISNETSLARHAKAPQKSLIDYFDRSNSSSSSEASEGGWTEVHDQSESGSDAGHSVQTHGTLGSAIVVDATINAPKKSPLMMQKKAATGNEKINHFAQETTPKSKGTVDGRPPRQKSVSPKKKRSKTKLKVDPPDTTEGDTSGLTSPATGTTKKKGKKTDFTKVKVIDAVTAFNTAESRKSTGDKPPKNKMKDIDEPTSSKLGELNDYIPGTPSKKKTKKKTIKCDTDDNVAASPNKDTRTTAESNELSPSKKKKKTKKSKIESVDRKGSDDVDLEDGTNVPKPSPAKTKKPKSAKEEINEPSHRDGETGAGSEKKQAKKKKKKKPQEE